MSSNAQQLRRSRLRILPGSILLGNLGSNEEPPAPPTEPPPEPPSGPPPDPTEIVRLVVLGDRRVGKSSVVQKFVTRRYCDPSNDDDGEGLAADVDGKSVRSGRSHRSHRSDKSHRNHHRDRNRRHRKPSASASASASSSRRYPMSPDGSHVSARSAENGEGRVGSDGIELIKAEYHKKDVTLWLPCRSNAPAQSSAAKADASQNRNTTKRSALERVSENHPSSFGSDNDHQNTKANEGDEQDQVCARVQVWDASGQDTFVSQETDDSNVQDKARKAAIISGTDSKWSQIFRNAAGALIVCTLGEDEGDGGGINGQHLDRQSIMDHLERRITRWVALIDAFTSPSSSADGVHTDTSTERSAKHRIPVSLILNKSDQVSNVLSSSEWVRVGAQMERLCERLVIEGGWYTSTCLDPRCDEFAQDPIF